MSDASQVLIVRARNLLCALALTEVVETMRPLPVSRLEGLPAFVLGAAMIRGAPVPVVDLGALLVGPEGARPTRFVTVRSAHRVAALALEEIVGVRSIARAELAALPPLLANAAGAAIAELQEREHELLAVLRGSRLVPDAAWNALGSQGDA